MKLNENTLNIVYKNNRNAKITPVVEDNKTAKKYRKKLAGKPRSKVDEEFWEYLLFLINNASEFTVQERNEIVQDISEYYYKQTGFQMPSEMLVACADIILDDTLADKDNRKSQKYEYPILSFRQISRRRKEVSLEPDTLEYFGNAEKNPPIKRRTSEKSINV